MGEGAGQLRNRAAGLCLSERRGCWPPGQVSTEDRARPPLSRHSTFKVPSPSVPGPHCVVIAVWTESVGWGAAAQEPGAGSRVWTEQAVWAGLPVTAGLHACHSPEHAHAPDIGCGCRAGHPRLWSPAGGRQPPPVLAWPAPQPVLQFVPIFRSQGPSATEGEPQRVEPAGSVGELVPDPDLREAEGRPTASSWQACGALMPFLADPRCPEPFRGPALSSRPDPELLSAP